MRPTTRASSSAHSPGTPAHALAGYAAGIGVQRGRIHAVDDQVEAGRVRAQLLDGHVGQGVAVGSDQACCKAKRDMARKSGFWPATRASEPGMETTSGMPKARAGRPAPKRSRWATASGHGSRQADVGDTSAAPRPRQRQRTWAPAGSSRACAHQPPWCAYSPAGASHPAAHSANGASARLGVWARGSVGLGHGAIGGIPGGRHPTTLALASQFVARGHKGAAEVAREAGIVVGQDGDVHDVIRNP